MRVGYTPHLVKATHIPTGQYVAAYDKSQVGARIKAIDCLEYLVES